MACLASANYDPSVSVSKSTASLLAMTALDTTNLRVTFTAPANGSVLVRMLGTIHGATTLPNIFLGVLDGATIRGRVIQPRTLAGASLATTRVPCDCSFVVTGLTAGTSYTWDAAYGVEVVVAATGIKYGGPNDTTTDNAFGAFAFEVWETANLLGAVLYDPATAATASCTALLAMTAMDTTNARITFTAPASGKVMWRIVTIMHGATAPAMPLLGILSSTTIMA